MIEITDKQWEFYLSKYENLLRTISRKISGDLMTATPEDNYADLCVAALESIRGYHKKTGIPVDEFIQTKPFDQYTKTVLWYLKANKGVKLTKKMPFRNAHFSINAPLSGMDEDSSFDLPDESLSTSSTLILDDMVSKTDSDVDCVVSAIMADPGVLKSSGKVNAYALLKPTGMSISEVNRALKKIGNILKENL